MKDSNPAPPPRSNSLWLAAIGLLVTVLSVIAIWWFHRAGRPASVESVTSTQPSTAGNANPSAERTFSLDDVARSTAGDRFVTAMIVDSRGCLWAGSEGGGVRRFDPSVTTGDKWTHFTIADGLGDQTVYALAVDRKGRIWAGHLNHGVSVFDGERWQNYDVITGADQSDSLAGPLGERVFAIKVCPTDGDVWIATNAGLSRYGESTGKWTYYTRADGLSSDATDCIAFDTDGNIYVGTQADGINIASASDQYANWRWVTGPSTITSTATGAGLPTSQINDLLMTRDNIIYAATPCGLAWSTDRGKSWTFTHGPDWMLRLKQSAAGLPANWKKPANLVIDDDFITSLAMDKLGSIYLGYRQHGVGKFTHDSDGALALDPTGGDANNNEMVRTLPADMTNYEVAGTYGQAIFPIGDEGKLPANTAESKAIEMPAGAAAVNPADLISQLPTVPEAEQNPLIIPLDDDWRTQGTWMGRYGRD